MVICIRLGQTGVWRITPHIGDINKQVKTVNRFPAFPKANKTCGGVHSVPTELRILAVKQRKPALPVKTRRTEVCQ
jgi:hypothetical protein